MKTKIPPEIEKMLEALGKKLKFKCDSCKKDIKKRPAVEYNPFGKSTKVNEVEKFVRNVTLKY